LFAKGRKVTKNVGVELYGDRGILLNILESESWGGLFDYGKDKLRDIVLDTLMEMI